MNVPSSDPAHLRVVPPVSDLQSLASHVAFHKVKADRERDLIWEAIDRHSDVLQALMLQMARVERLQWAVLALGVVSPLAAWLLGGNASWH